AGAHRHGGPAVQKTGRPEAGTVGPEVAELLCEQASSYGAKVQADELAELASLLRRAVLSALEQDPPSLREPGGAPGGTQPAYLLPPDRVDCLAEQLRDVEAVQDMDGRRAAEANDLAEGFPHVAGDEQDALGAFLAEHVEEAVEAGGGSIPRDVQQAAAPVVELVDEREVLVPLLPGQLVDTDRPDAVEASVLQAPAHGVFDGAEDRV